jgi:hypothetical protein
MPNSEKLQQREKLCRAEQFEKSIMDSLIVRQLKKAIFLKTYNTFYLGFTCPHSRSNVIFRNGLQ